MARLRLRLLGPFRATLDGEPVTSFETDKVRALLAYLAVEAERPHRRQELAGLLWPDWPERSARANLRNALSNLRQAIGDRQAQPPFLLISRASIQFNPASDHWRDVCAFEELVGAEGEGERSIQRLEKALSLYRGAFLEGFSLKDSAGFEDWSLLVREQLRRRRLSALGRLAQGYAGRGEYERACEVARQRVELDPLDEEAHRALMGLYAGAGRRGDAVRQYRACVRVLEEELGVSPAAETTALYEQIRAETEAAAPIPTSKPLQAPAALPAFLSEETETVPVQRPIFVAREQELARLEGLLEAALAGKGQVVFITGGPGRGKTTLMREFAQRAMETDVDPDLLIASGNGSAYTGVGDSYLPFRQVMDMLTGDVEGRWASGTLSRKHARRLWDALPQVAQALLEHGPYLVDILVPGSALLSRTRASAGPAADMAWLGHLQEWVERPRGGTDGGEQGQIFHQFSNVLQALAAQYPLVLLLDDLQWADAASISMLFHLGQRLTDAGGRILVAGAYRPEEVAIGRDGERHPLEKVLAEFKRRYGDVWVDLVESDRLEGRAFVDALLDSEPNRLGEDFRSALFHRTRGHPLFTVELLRVMQERRDLVQDTEGQWVTGPVLDWKTLPVRVKAVIEERADRLDDKLRDILTVASVEGERFTAQVVAQLQDIPERELLRTLSRELAARHRLVQAAGEAQVGGRYLSRYQFVHALYREHLYDTLSAGERRLLHGETAAALEKLYEGQLDEMAVQLAHHFHQAGDSGRAFQYFTVAAERAFRLYANDEAITHYTRAIELAERVSPDVASLTRLHRGRGLACERLGDFDRARSDHDATLQIARASGERQVEWRALLDLGKLWSSRDYNQTRDCFEGALELARRMDDPALLAESLNWMGNWYTNNESPLRAVEYHQEALKIIEELGDARDLANTLDLLGIAHLLGADLSASVRYYDRAITLFRELDDRPSLASSLMGRATIVSQLVQLASVPAVRPPESARDCEEALRIAREIDSAPDEAWAFWVLGLLHTVQGQFGRALEYTRNGLGIALKIGHREWEVGNRSALGVLYSELFAPDRARRELERALTLAGELQSQYWIHQVSGALAGVYLTLDERKLAQASLETVISPQTPVDTMGKRYCWVRRAELALAQGDPALALEITDRLIASAPGLASGRVITFLWKLKGEAFAAMGCTDEAESLLLAAIDNAQATGERFLLWRVHASLGRLYRTMGHQEAAETECSTARALIDEMAATIPEDALKSDFLQGAYNTLGVG